MVNTDQKNKVLLLNLIALANDQGIVGKTRVQKLIFMIQNELEPANGFNYEFIRWHYGPYSSKLTKDLEFLVRKNFIEINEQNQYKISEYGQQFLEKQSIKKFLEEIDSDKIFSNTLENYNDLALRELLELVYKNFKIKSNYDKGETIIGAK